MPEGLRARVNAICEGFPEVEPSSRTGQHSAYAVRGKKFAYFTVDHHGDGMVALSCKAAPGAQALLVASAPEQFFVPPYLGHHGWVGVDLEHPETNWDEVAELLANAYRLTAPKRLTAAM